MILPDFILPKKANQCWQYSGIDSLEECYNKSHFQEYPYNVDYKYNSRGFRDQEWPDSIEELKKSIWCVGDSFTVGIGSPIEHTWPWLLQQQTGCRTINVSMDGASNQWISRKTIDILQKIQPKYIVLHWSFVQRREAKTVPQDRLDQLWRNLYYDCKDPSWPLCDTLEQFNYLPEHIKTEILVLHGGIPTGDDEDRRIHEEKYTTHDDDINNILECIRSVEGHQLSTKIIHSFIPEFVPNDLNGVVETQLSGVVIPELVKKDLARDGFHYDKLTSQELVNLVISRIDSSLGCQS